jgi:hypothetical protein
MAIYISGVRLNKKQQDLEHGACGQRLQTFRRALASRHILREQLVKLTTTH